MKTLHRIFHASMFAFACAAATVSVHAADDSFAKKAAAGGLAEVASGELAKQKGESEAVKTFGDSMVQDHSKANDELKAIAAQKNITLPTEPDAKHKKALESLKGKSGKQFDDAFKKQMVKDHQETISLFEKQAKSGSDAELKAFAVKTLPTLKHHLEMARALK